MKLKRNWVVFGAALIVGLIAALSVQRYIQQRLASIQPPASTGVIDVVVAASDLARGTRLDAKNVAVRKVPREWAHSNAILPKDFDRAEKVALAHVAARGEPILWAQLEGQQAASFSSRLVAGRRAVTVPVDEISSISGMVAPGDAIDLMVALRHDGKVVMLPVLQDVRVLATGTQVVPGRKEDAGSGRTFTTVTLDATPEDARRIMAAREVGRVTALLRAPGDAARHGMRAAEATTLLGLVTSRSGADTRPGVQVLYGGQRAAQAVAPLPADRRVATADPSRGPSAGATGSSDSSFVRGGP